MKKLYAMSAMLALGLLLQGQTILAATPGQAAPLLTITAPSGPVVFGENPEYATLVWNDPWDMSTPTDVRQLDSPQCVFPNHFDSYSPCEAGVWCGKVRADVGNPDLFLLHPGYDTEIAAYADWRSAKTNRTGTLRPIDASFYTQLTFRMYIDSVDSSDPGWQVLWTNESVADIGPNHTDTFGESHLFKAYASWHIYTIDLSIYQNSTPPNALGKLPWTGEITGLRLDPGLVNMNNKIVKLDWVRLTTRQNRNISWTTNLSGSVEILLQSADWTDSLQMYRIRSQDGTEWTEPLNIPASQGSFDMPASLPPGDWYVELRSNEQTSSAAGPWQVRAAPRVRILTPSFTSGQDYAQSELHNSWDMNDAGNVCSYGNTTAPAFNNGILSSTNLDTNPLNTCSGYWENPYLNFVDDNYWDPPYTTSPPIDTSKYRYFSFRIKLDRIPDISYGDVARVVWSDLLFEKAGVTAVIPLVEGWNEVSIDLWSPSIIARDDVNQSPWRASPTRRQISLHPLESPTSVTYHLDWVKLTAMDQADTSFNIRWELTDPDSNNVTLNIHAVNEQNEEIPIATITAGSRVTAPALSVAAPDQPAGEYKVYLPLVLNSYCPPCDWEGNCITWNTSNVPAGTYYVHIVANDGYNVTNWSSETPVVIKH